MTHHHCVKPVGRSPDNLVPTASGNGRFDIGNRLTTISDVLAVLLPTRQTMSLNEHADCRLGSANSRTRTSTVEGYRRILERLVRPTLGHLNVGLGPTRVDPP